MKIGIMQPYFFPYLGYFAHLATVDKWVVFDSSQYTKKTWMNRNRIANNSGSWSYISMPVQKGSLSMKTSEARAADFITAKQQLFNSLAQYKAKAPYFKQVMLLVDEALSSVASDKLVDINISCLQSVCDYLGINFNYAISSHMDIDYSSIHHPGQWALEISKHCHASVYINPLGGKELFDQSAFDEAQIELSFFNPPKIDYVCIKPFEYIENLSILDVLMWCSPDEVTKVISPS